MFVLVVELLSLYQRVVQDGTLRLPRIFRESVWFHVEWRIAGMNESWDGGYLIHFIPIHLRVYQGQSCHPKNKLPAKPLIFSPS